MPLPTTLAPLMELMRTLHDPDPERWARAVLADGPNSLLAALFVRQAWNYAVPPGDTRWIDDEMAQSAKNPTGPYAGLGLALRRCREKGVEDKDLTEMARCLQGAMIFHLSYLLSDPIFPEPELADVSWGLFQVDDDNRPMGESIAGMHEMVLSQEPGQREMCPE